MLMFGGLVLGAWNRWAALFAFTVAVPLLNGLGQTSFLNCTFAPSLVFSGLWTGIVVRNLSRRIMKHQSRATSSAVWRPSYLAKTVDAERSGKNFQYERDIMEPKKHEFSFSSHFVSFAIHSLIAAVLLSLAWQFWRHRESAGLWTVCINQAVMGYGDPWYFLTSAFLWLQGLFYFAIMDARLAERWTGGSDLIADDMAVVTWVRPVLTAYGVTMVVFFLLQGIFHNPEGWARAGFQSPYEDISSFGSVSVSVFVFAVATFSVAPLCKSAIAITSCIGLLAMVVASFSRSAWVAGLTFLLLIAAFRLSRIWTSAFVLLLIALITVSNANANRPYWANHPYLTRLGELMRLENPTNKSIGRLNLYSKAVRMIKVHPFTGHGIGSFYLESVSYGESTDARGMRPDFAHDVFLQIAVEEGVPIATLFAGLTAWALWRGLRSWFVQKVAGLQNSAGDLLNLGVPLTLGAYLQTQVTANSLNVYVSNQFFFWFLMVVTLAVGTNRPGACD